MQNVLLMIFPAMLLVLTFYRTKFAEKGLLSDTFLSLDQSKNIQASVCLAIILHHLTQQITVYGMRPKGPITLLSYIGYLFTALFFFFSGYGLMTSLESKPDYLDNFLKHRLPAVIIPFWIINILGVILTSILPGPKLTLPEIASDIVGLTLINSNGWYIIEIVILYLLFYILFKLIKNRNLAMILLCAATLFIIIYSFFNGHDPEGAKAHWFRGEWWFNSTIAFAYGIVFVKIRDKFSKFCNRHYGMMTALFVFLSVIFIWATVFAQKNLGYYHEPVHHGMRDAAITLVIQSVSCIIFTTMVLILNMKLAIGNKPLHFIRRMSLELFLIHGYFLDQIFGRIKMNDFLLFAVVILCSIIFCAIISPLIKFTVKKLTALLNRKRIKNSTLEQSIKDRNRAKKLRIFLIIVLILIISAIIYLAAIRPISIKQRYSKEKKGLNEASVGDIVTWGKYDTNPVTPGKESISWIILEKDSKSALLISEKGLAGSYYNQHHTEVTWNDCDIRNLINTGALSRSFCKYELGDMLPIDGDLISLLSAEEAEKLFSCDEDRELLITPIAEAQGTNINNMSKHHEWDMVDTKTSWWWLKGDSSTPSITAPIVTVDGEISLDEKYVNKPGGAIRPVIRVKLD